MSRSTTTHEHVRRMLDEIHQRYNQRLTLACLASALGRQSAYLGRLFREEIGVTVHEYITRARMVFGAAEVRAGVKIEAVSLDLGYRSKKNFYRQFKRRFGMTPEAYRNGGSRANAFSAAGPLGKRTNHQLTASECSTSNIRSAAFSADQRLDDDSSVARRPRQKMRRAGWSAALLVTDEHGCYVGATAAAVALTGYSVDELRGMRAEALFPDGSGSKARCRLQVLYAGSAARPATCILQTKSTGQIRVHVISVENILGAPISRARAFSPAR